MNQNISLPLAEANGYMLILAMALAKIDVFTNL